MVSKKRFKRNNQEWHKEATFTLMVFHRTNYGHTSRMIISDSEHDFLVPQENRWEMITALSNWALLAKLKCDASREKLPVAYILYIRTDRPIKTASFELNWEQSCTGRLDNRHGILRLIEDRLGLLVVWSLATNKILLETMVKIARNTANSSADAARFCSIIFLHNENCCNYTQYIKMRHPRDMS